MSAIVRFYYRFSVVREDYGGCIYGLKTGAAMAGVMIAVQTWARPSAVPAVVWDDG